MPGAWFGITDIKDCFHNMLVPEWLSDSFTLIPMTAEEVGIEFCTLLQNGCKVVLESETLVSPAWSALPMGCSWSFVFCSERDRDHCVSRPCVGRSPPLHDKAKDLVLGRRVGAQAYYVYVDNLGVIAKTQQEADIVLEQWKHLFT